MYLNVLIMEILFYTQIVFCFIKYHYYFCDVFSYLGKYRMPLRRLKKAARQPYKDRLLCAFCLLKRSIMNKWSIAAESAGRIFSKISGGF